MVYYFKCRDFQNGNVSVGGSTIVCESHFSTVAATPIKKKCGMRNELLSKKKKKVDFFKIMRYVIQIHLSIKDHSAEFENTDLVQFSARFAV